MTSDDDFTKLDPTEAYEYAVNQAPAERARLLRLYRTSTGNEAYRTHSMTSSPVSSSSGTATQFFNDGPTPFTALGVVAKIITLVGWTSIAIGAILALVALVSLDSPYQTEAMGLGKLTLGISALSSGFFLVLGGGAVQVLIAIEGHLRK